MSYFVNNLPYDPCTSGSFYQLRSRIYAEHAPTYTMAANAGVVKAIVSFYRIDSDTAFERHRSRMPINDVNTVHALQKHLGHFLDSRNWQVNTCLVTLTSRFTDCWVGKATTSPSPQTTSGSWNYQACWMIQEAK